MALPTTNITTAMVRNELGASTNNVGELCIHPNIKFWANNKPHSIVAPANAEIDGIYPIVHGLWRLKNGDVMYKKPSGGESDPYRLGDFRSYGIGWISEPFPPCRLNVITPSSMIEGFTSNMTFQLITGNVNPVNITEKTNPIKQLGSEGYGGIAIAARGLDEGDVISSNSVFSANSGTQSIQINSNLFDAYYVEKDIDNVWRVVGGTAPYLIEDLSYRDAILVEPFGVEFGTTSVFWLDFAQQMGPILSLSAQLENTTTATRNPVIITTATLTNVNGSWNISPSQSGITLNGGATGSYSTDLSFQNVAQGSNTVSGNIKLFYFGVQVGETKNFSRTFTATTPI